ncbi:TPA: hypothetical protein R4X90_001569 [Enterobacter hormaechei subsp. xiangfangensis]|uniref:hypothetical protein n=1 Tax=Enterobacter TaxID=547 RepID=UPI0009496D09|nr:MULTISPECIES: hypothetical protein [Enterobacter]EGQ5285373.1 hypothetical protein [Enterobacter hormaechei]ELN8896458.1 hypothetical protein [Enterobacter hormaechei subsp. xiangfangensis]HCM9177842.1 hypothetical protein [Enterobacter kobei]HCM9673637.1 hypothetical protein [Enterobacter roggenkampii]EKY3922762.1 hypothetical protein [Enterobacter hormaechei]
MRLITFDNIESAEVANELVDTIRVECITNINSNVISFENIKQERETLEAFVEIMNTDIIFD